MKLVLGFAALALGAAIMACFGAPLAATESFKAFLANDSFTTFAFSMFAFVVFLGSFLELLHTLFSTATWRTWAFYGLLYSTSVAVLVLQSSAYASFHHMDFTADMFNSAVIIATFCFMPLGSGMRLFRLGWTTCRAVWREKPVPA